MTQQLQVVADPTANADQGGVNLPAGAASLSRLTVGGAVWIERLTGEFSTFNSASLNGHVPRGDIVIVIGTDITHAVQIGSNGSVETTF
jgi:hypothetical protein